MSDDRIYFPIWKKLKALAPKDAESIGVSIICNRLLHGRVIKAVTKEKWMDMGFRLHLSDTKQQCFLSHVRDGSKLTFFLAYKSDGPIPDMRKFNRMTPAKLKAFLSKL